MSYQVLRATLVETTELIVQLGQALVDVIQFRLEALVLLEVTFERALVIQSVLLCDKGGKLTATSERKREGGGGRRIEERESGKEGEMAKIEREGESGIEQRE